MNRTTRHISCSNSCPPWWCRHSQLTISPLVSKTLACKISDESSTTFELYWPLIRHTHTCTDRPTDSRYFRPAQKWAELCLGVKCLPHNSPLSICETRRNRTTQITLTLHYGTLKLDQTSCLISRSTAVVVTSSRIGTQSGWCSSSGSLHPTTTSSTTVITRCLPNSLHLQQRYSLSFLQLNLYT